MFDQTCGSYSRTRILNEEKSFVKGVTEGANFRRAPGGVLAFKSKVRLLLLSPKNGGWLCVEAKLESKIANYVPAFLFIR